MAWYNEDGQSRSYVLSTRVRFARNLVDYPFSERMNREIALEILGKLEAALPELQKINFEDLPDPVSLSYAEKRLVSRDFLGQRLPHLLFLGEGEKLAVMAMEEDHLRIQAILPGLAVKEAYALAKKTEARLTSSLTFAFDPRLGYLTHCPTNLGTAMRISAMLFLPALESLGQIERLLPSLTRLGFTLRGMYGEGSGSSGALYQISNQITMGITEGETVTKMEELIRQIIGFERQAREQLREDDRIADEALRAYGTLRYARSVTSAEFMELYKRLRFGLCLGVEELPGSLGSLDPLVVEVMPGTLTAATGCGDERSRDKCRASCIKKQLAKAPEAADPGDRGAEEKEEPKGQ